MATIKISEATEIVLDWLVTNSEGHELGAHGFTPIQEFLSARAGGFYRYSTDPAQAWPIIDRVGIECGRCWNEGKMRTNPYDAAFARIPFVDAKFVRLYEYGATPLIAAMRVYLSSVMGDTAEVPDAIIRHEGKCHV